MKVLAFDANIIVNRAFYGVRLLSTREGTYTNAVYGFFNIVYKLIEEQKPDAVAFAFDLRAPTFRHKMYEQYKGTRKGMPEELRQQMPLVKEMLRRMIFWAAWPSRGSRTAIPSLSAPATGTLSSSSPIRSASSWPRLPRRAPFMR